MHIINYITEFILRSKEFSVTQNIGYKEIDEFIDYYRWAIDNVDLVEDEVGIIFNPKNTKDLQGEVDPIYLSYLILFLEDFPNTSLKFTFNNNEDEDRALSLKHQLEHIRFMLNCDESRLKLEGFYKSGKEINLYSFNNYTNVKTGEIIDSKHEIDKAFLRQSSSFMPPLFINHDWQKFFKKNYQQNEQNILFEKYFEKLKYDIDLLVGSKSKESFVQNLKLEELSFLEVLIFRLLVSRKTKLYKRLKAPLGQKSNRNEIAFNIKYNKDVIIGLKVFVTRLVLGIKELAVNIYEHSSAKKGVITARIYDKTRLIKLKSQDEINYLEGNSNDLFLDINIIDFGDQMISKKYLETLKNTKDKLLGDFDGDLKLFNQLDISFEKDADYIKNNYSFKDFFVIDPIKLNNISHQKNKLISRIGLHFFTQLMINEYNAFIKISSQSEKTSIYKNSESNSIPKYTVNRGTFYNCLVPVSPILSENKDENNFSGKLSKSELNTFESLHNTCINSYDASNQSFETPFISDGSEYLIQYKYTGLKAEKLHKYSLVSNFYKSLKPIKDKLKNSILVINLSDFEFLNLEDPTEWIKLISVLNDICNDVIVYNIDIEVTQSIFLLQKAWASTGLCFWEFNKKTLFYSKKYSITEGKTGNLDNIYRYGVNVLAGNSVNEFDAINAQIWNHHYGHRDNIFNYQNGKKWKILSKEFYDSALFHNKGLKYFELILKTHTENEDSISLFEKSVQYSLYTDFESKATYRTNNKGYKIKDTHFRLGSKIHIDDFYYAKKIFQNSFFTTPLAYLLAKEIISDLSNHVISDLTIVGYEDYSSFLVSTVRNFLRKLGGENIPNKLNHLTIDKNGRLSREVKKLNNFRVIIVPIASSFSTSLRIDNQLNNIKESFEISHENEVYNSKVLNNDLPHYNLISVTNKDYGNKLYEDCIDENGSVKEFSIFYDYNWRYINKENKIIGIAIQNYLDDVTGVFLRMQKYFIPVYTKWRKAENCENCFSTNIDNELCLFETGSASITPRLIIGMPKTTPVVKFGNNKLDLTGSLLYGYLKKRDNKYLYFNRTGKILKTNLTQIKNWILDVKRNLDIKIENKKVVIVTPASGSRSNFIDLLNELLFEYSANYLTISIEEDYIENAEALYSDGLHNADIVVYVDDVLSSAASFLETNYIVKYIRNKYRSGRGIDYCIALINRMSYDNEENLLLKLVPFLNDQSHDLATSLSNSKLKEKKTELNSLISLLSDKEIKLDSAKNRLYYFQKINNPAIQEPNNDFPLDLERSRYKKLANYSSLDAIREYFFRKRLKLKPVNLKNSPSDKVKDYTDSFNNNKRKHKKLYQLLVLNAIYSLFEYNLEGFDKDNTKGYNDNRLNTLEECFAPNLESLDNLTKKIRKILKDEHESHQYVIRKNRDNLDFVILKIICSTPLVYYKTIREGAFAWIQLKLLEIRKKYLVKLNVKSFPEHQNNVLENLLLFFEVKDRNYYSKYQEWKFLLKKSVQLKSNFIIHIETFKDLRILINSIFENQSKLIEVSSMSDNDFIKKVQFAFEDDKINCAGRFEIFEYWQNCHALDLINISFFDALKGLLNNNSSKGGFEFILRNESQEFLKEKNHELKNKLPDQGLFLDDYSFNYKIGFNRNISQKYTIGKVLEIKSIPKYSIPTSKRLIYHLLSMVQELLFEHEIKAIKLEKNIKLIRSLFHHEDDQNGDFNHYLRLLRLENTEIIHKLWFYIKNREQHKETKKIDLNKISNIGNVYKHDQKYKTVRDELLDNSTENESFCLNKYLLLMGNLHNQLKVKEPDKLPSVDDKGIEGFIKGNLLTYIIEIINNQKFDLDSTYSSLDSLAYDAFLTVNFNKSKTPNNNDVHVFSLRDKTDNYDNVRDKESITLRMLKGIDDQYNYKNVGKSFKLSNLEIIKDIDGDIVIRKGLVNEYNENRCPQFKNLPKGHSILLIRISEFDGFGENKSLYSQAVLTVYINNDKRVSETRFRLLLALRKSISSYIGKQISDNSLIEFIKRDTVNKYQRDLRHGITDFIGYQKTIIQEYEKIEDKIEFKSNVDLRQHLDQEYIDKASFRFKEFLLINNSISSQIGISKKNVNIDKTFFADYFKDIINTIYMSEKIGEELGSLDVAEELEYANNKNFNDIRLPVIIVDTVIPELITNQKKYGKERKITWEEDENFLNIKFSNKVDKVGEGYGVKMCKNIVKNLKNRIILDFNQPNNHYIVILKILKKWKQ